MNAQLYIDTTVMNILSEVLGEPVPALRAQPVLAAHRWDSLNALETLAQVEEELGVTLDLRAFQSIREVGDLVELISRAKAHQSASPAELDTAGPPARTSS